MKELIERLDSAAEKARLHLEKHHAPRSWTEVMRELRVLAIEASAALNSPSVSEGKT